MSYLVKAVTYWVGMVRKQLLEQKLAVFLQHG